MVNTKEFYDYLVNNGLIAKNRALDEFAELTRLEDTWEWKNAGDLGLKAHDLAILFNIIGKEKYIDEMFKKLRESQDGFEFTNEEKKLVSNRKEEYLNLLKEIWSNAEFFNDESGNYYSAVFSNYEYRNELTEYAKDLNIENLKYLIIVGSS